MEAPTWQLGAAESLLLQKGPKTSGAEVLKMALTELIASRRLRLDPGPKPLIRRGPARVGSLRPSLRALLDIFERASTGREGIEVAQLVKAVRHEYGGLDRYRERVVLAGMVDEGLFARERYWVLWLFPATRHVPTFAGQSAKQRLDDLQRRIELDPDAAIPVTGVAMLLADSFDDGPSGE
jgi:hypothetical protein